MVAVAVTISAAPRSPAATPSPRQCKGAGGNGNVLKELVDPAGAVYRVSNFTKGDPTLSAMELWGAEYQENDAFILSAEDRCANALCPSPLSVPLDP
jgi:phosphoribosylformylglycinamidine synthase